MSKPVDIKIAHINPEVNDDQSLDKAAVWEVFQNNNNEVVKHIIKNQNGDFQKVDETIKKKI